MGKRDDVKRVKEMAGIQWERLALHIWQEDCRESEGLQNDESHLSGGSGRVS
jgi:hypothetical protein